MGESDQKWLKDKEHTVLNQKGIRYHGTPSSKSGKQGKQQYLKVVPVGSKERNEIIEKRSPM